MCEIGWLVRWRFPVVSKVLCICVGKGKVFKVVFVGSLGWGFHAYWGRALQEVGISNLELCFVVKTVVTGR